MTSTSATRVLREARVVEPRIVVLGGDDPPPPHGFHPLLKQRPPPPGPQLWAVVLTSVGLYYVWTRVLGRSIPAIFVRGSGQHVGSAKKDHNNTDRHADMVAAREKQQRRLRQQANKQQEDNDNNRNVSSSLLCNDADGISRPPLSIRQRVLSLRERQEEIVKQLQLEEKKKKQRTLYLKRRALESEEEEIRRKDAELGPGWRYREDPTAAAASNPLNGMDPQGGTGGYKPQVRKRQGG